MTDGSSEKGGVKAGILEIRITGKLEYLFTYIQPSCYLPQVMGLV